MPRIRTITPEIVQDEKLGKLPRDARLLFILLWPCSCDDHGRFRASPIWLKSNLFPYDDDIGPAEVAEWLNALHDNGRIVLYSVGGEAYGCVTNWSKHQRVDNAGAPLHPGPDDTDTEVRGEPRRTAANRGEMPLDLGPRTIGPRTADPRAATPRADDTFAAFWNEYPRKVSKTNASKAWAKLDNQERDAALQTIKTHVTNWRADPSFPKYVPHPATWLNGKRWNDDIGETKTDTLEWHGVQIAESALR